MGYLDAGVFIALACEGRWRARDAGVGLTLASGKGARIGSITLAFLLRWRVRDAGVGLTLASGKGARIGSLTLAFPLRSVTDAPAL